MNVVDFRIDKNHKNVTFLKILPLLNCHKINTVPGQISKIHTINFRMLRKKCVLLPENCFGVEQMPASKYPKIKTFFVIGLSLDMTLFFARMMSIFLLHQCELILYFLADGVRVIESNYLQERGCCVETVEI